ncbi:MAG TPA: exonuclease domain-containing protein [Chitinophagaceae bacterium]|nr:exonuclease domain-containing protein [Chitinophagaceae bacterium]
MKTTLTAKQPTYAVVDVETTGGIAAHHRITEIAVLVHDGHQVREEFSTLINPETIIPSGISRLTGISNEMVSGAPKFCEVARTIVELTRGHIFVAHNARFDYHFLRWEFQRLGYPFRCETLCTVKLSRKLIPGLPSYSLGNLCQSLGIRITDRHRAAGDARATVTLLERLLSIQRERIGEFTDLTMADLGKEVDQRLIRGLPQETGIYYLRDPLGNILYIGKSRDIRSRVVSHLADASTQKAMRLRNSVHSVDFERTGSELIAMLLESEEIKKFSPQYNRAQKRKEETYCLASSMDEQGYRNFQITRTEDSDQPLELCSTLEQASEQLFSLKERFGLCESLCHLNDTTPCFAYQVKTCHGACLGLETPAAYNARADQAAAFLLGAPMDCLLLDQGRDPGEISVIRIALGNCGGFGYVDESVAADPESLRAAIRPYAGTRDSRRIIRRWLREHPRLQLADCDVCYSDDQK